MSSLEPTQTTARVLDVQNLSVTVQGRTLLNRINLQIAQGERICLLGPSGAGKSLLARALIGTLPPEAHVTGHILLNGIPITQCPPAQRRPSQRVASVHQDAFHALNPLYTVGRQLIMVLEGAQSLTRAQARAQLPSLLARVALGDVSHLAERYPAELSGGQRQRVCIAMALASRASLLVADEPTTALDVVTQAGILHTLRQFTALPEAPALCFITHDIGVAARLCQRGLVLYDGTLVEQGPLSALLSTPTHPYTQRMAEAAHHARHCAAGAV